jgi:hypothetical protein
MTIAAIEVDLVRETVLELSTSHITAEDNEILKEFINVPPEKHPQVVMAYEPGFMVSAWHNFKDNPENLEAELLKLGHSPAYINILKIAHSNGCKWVNLDADASKLSFLPTYDW